MGQSSIYLVRRQRGGGCRLRGLSDLVVEYVVVVVLVAGWGVCSTASIPFSLCAGTQLPTGPLVWLQCSTTYIFPWFAGAKFIRLVEVPPVTFTPLFSAQVAAPLDGKYQDVSCQCEANHTNTSYIYLAPPIIPLLFELVICWGFVSWTGSWRARRWGRSIDILSNGDFSVVKFGILVFAGGDFNVVGGVTPWLAVGNGITASFWRSFYKMTHHKVHSSP